MHRPLSIRTLPFFLALALFPPAARAGEPPRPITVGDCVKTALANNLDVALFRTEADSAAQGIPIEEAAFRPRFESAASAARSVVPNASALIGSSTLDQDTLKLDASGSELLPWGTTLSLSFAAQRQETNSAVALLSPEYDSGLTLSARHPLLRNAGRTATQGPLVIARAGAAAKADEWKARVMDAVAGARLAFFAFHAAGEEAAVRATALELAERLLGVVRARIAAGTAAPMDRLPAEATVAARRVELIRAEAARQAAADDLKTALGVRSVREWEESLVPVPPAEPVAPPGPADTFEEAMRARPEVAALAAQRTAAEVREAVARDGVRPTLDLSVSAGLSGAAGTPNPSPLFAGSGTALEGDFRDSLDRMVSGRYYNWFVGIRTEFPWGYGRERAEWARARSGLEGFRLQEEALRLRILAEVRKARRDVETALARIAAAGASVDSAREKLEAEGRKLSLGASTAAQVLTFQQDYAEALLSRVRAWTDARVAETRLRRATGSILDREGIVAR